MGRFATTTLSGLPGPRQTLRSLISLGGSPHGIAGGFTLGLVLSLVPIPFAGMLVALALAPLLRLNLPATYVGTAIVNPLSGAFIYAAELWIGMAILGRPLPPWAELRALDASGWFALLVNLAGPFALGVAVLAGAAIVLAYPAIHFVAARWRNPRRTNEEGADPPQRTDASE
jgi:uncharacterized protein (DUF2062 family)